ncbi:MAG: metallophosphoesterase [Clostridia bacterium]|nr:metallophosphoesterase [Clostridia bacterium]
MAFIMSVLVAITSGGYNVTGGYEMQTSKGEFVKLLFNQKETIGEKHVGKPSEDVWSEEDEYTLDYGAAVYKEKDRDFRILNVADIHFSDFGYRIFTGIGAEAVLRAIVNDVKPDLITLSGDMVCSDSDWYSIRRLTDLMESFGIPWAPVFGNHDDESNCDQNFLCDVMMSGPHCLLKKGDPRMGCGNYAVNIIEKDESGGRLIETLLMTDSHHSQPNEIQNQWAKWVCEGTKRISGGNAEVSAIMHIPLPEYETAYKLYHSGDSWDENCGGTGDRFEKICCEYDENDNPFSRGFFDVLKEAGNAKYVFCGHDHLNDFSVIYEGIRLTYMMKIGMASGFRPGFDGGTVITVGTDGIKAINHKTVSLTGFRDRLTVNI